MPILGYCEDVSGTYSEMITEKPGVTGSILYFSTNSI